jgi:hypothetical protein
MYPLLKLRIKALAEEARLTRAMANKRLTFSRSVRNRMAAGHNRAGEQAEAGEMALQSYGKLHHHRTVKVRHAARTLQLTYAFLRGRSLLGTEPQICGRHTTRPDWVAVLRIAAHHRADDTLDITRPLLLLWIGEAGMNAARITGWKD